MNYSIVAFGEALWDLLPTGAELGGATLNFAYRAASLGNRGVTISRLGQDELGRSAHDRMASLGMQTDYLQWDLTHPTGTVKVSLDEHKNPDFTIIENTAYDYIEMTNELSDLVGEADCLCFGTLAQRSFRSRSTLDRLLECFVGKYRFLDVNLRKNCYTEQTVKASIARSDILKMNETEAPEINAMFAITEPALPAATAALVEDTGVAYCVVTLGAKGAFAASKDGEMIYLPTYPVDIVDTCGSGDGFSAGFVDSILRGKSLSEACRRGNALGALVARQKGATEPVSVAAIERQIAGGSPGPIESQLEEYNVWDR